MCSSVFVEISHGALQRNAAAIRKAVGVPVIGILKCNGYGVTVCEAAAAWQAAGVTIFGVSRPEEALELRRCGFREDILLLSPVADTQTLEQMLSSNVILTVSGLDNARFYSMYAAEHSIRAHLAIDTGMGRFGIRWSDTQQAKAVYTLPGLSFEGIFSHFSCSFEKNYRTTRLQLTRFLRMTEALKADGIPVGIRHIANSCAALRFPETRLDAVRIGSALVGRLPIPVPIVLERVGSFKAQAIDCKLFYPGDTTGYGSRCKFRKRKKAVIVALGRQDGFGFLCRPDQPGLLRCPIHLLRLLRAWMHPPCIEFHGQKLRLLGRIGNQHTLFDATGMDIKPGEQVEWEGNLMLSNCERRFL